MLDENQVEEDLPETLLVVVFHSQHLQTVHILEERYGGFGVDLGILQIQHL